MIVRCGNLTIHHKFKNCYFFEKSCGFRYLGLAVALATWYNKSIADGYTLKIKKESIATKFKNDVRSILNLKEDEDVSPTKWESITNSDEFVNQLCAYIDKDYQEFRRIQKNDNSLGFMIVTTGSEQAEKIQKWFKDNSTLKTCLVLYDEDDNSGKQKAFKGTKNKETGKLESPYDEMDLCLVGNRFKLAYKCKEGVLEKIRLTRKENVGIVVLSEVFVWEMLQVHRLSLL